MPVRKNVSGFSEEAKRIIAEGRCGPSQGFACRPYLQLEEIRREALTPEHLDELHSLARGCLEAVLVVRQHASTLLGNDDDRWWVEFSLVNAMTTALRTVAFLNAGLESEILLAYPSSVEIPAAGLTRNNAHRLAADIAIELVCRAWNAVYRANDIKPTSATMIFTFRRPLVRMLPSDESGLPLFKAEHVSVVVDAIQGFPDFDPGGVRGRVQWENAKVKERRAATAQQAGRRPVAESQRVRLFGPNDPPLIDGRPKSPLTKARYDIVRRLVEAGPEGLTKDGLASEHGGAVNSLKALARGDGDWKDVIKLPGKTGRRYRIE